MNDQPGIHKDRRFGHVRRFLIRERLIPRLSGCLAIGLAAAVCCRPGTAAAEDRTRVASVESLIEMDLEELMAIPVTSVSRKEEPASKAPAAVFVLTGEEIRRSGAASIPEALRLVPGVHVARINANKWAVSIRGFNGLYAYKLLVLVDGRSIYSPLFSGIIWEAEDLLLDDIARIEVIRGPGASVWGANAVNGVINIITKHSRDTRGGMLKGIAGTEERGGAFRYGGGKEDGLTWRVWSKYMDFDGQTGLRGERAEDDWDTLRGGFRLDKSIGGEDSLMLQGDIFDVDTRYYLTAPRRFPGGMTTFTDDYDSHGGYLLGRWERTFSDTDNLALQLYYDYADHELSAVHEIRHIGDIDFQHRLAAGNRHEIVWGAGWRVSADNLGESYVLTFDPARRTDHLFSAFAQDTITLAEDRLALTLGLKLEHNDYSGLEIQPTARLRWTPGARHTLWAAVSRAVQTPTRGFHDMRINAARFPGGLVAILPNPDSGSEELLAYEAGWRVQAADTVSLDFAAYLFDYDDLRTAERLMIRPECRFFPPHILIPVRYDNKMHGLGYGFEAAINWQARPNWLLSAGYSLKQLDLELEPGSSDSTAIGKEAEYPAHQASLRSCWDITDHIELDAMLYYADRLSGLDVDSYTRADLRLGWTPREDLALSIMARNLFDGQHKEYRSIEGLRTTEAERSIYGMVTWQF
jgi:iron complex outermembrane recepter protein